MFVLPLSRSSHIAPHHAALAPQLSRAADRLFEQSLARILRGPAAVTDRAPAIDVVETDITFSVLLDVPGVARDQLKVSVEGRRVSVETVDAPKVDSSEAPEKPGESGTAPDVRVLYRERGAARYSRTIVLPGDVDQATSQARLDNGVLTLTLVKKMPDGATRLTVA